MDRTGTDRDGDLVERSVRDTDPGTFKTKDQGLEVSYFFL